MVEEQVKVSIPKTEWEKASIVAKRECFKTTTSWIRHIIRTKTVGA